MKLLHLKDGHPVLRVLKNARAVFASSFPTKVLRESRFNDDMILRQELVDYSSGTPLLNKPMLMASVYSVIDGSYVGDVSTACYFAVQGIAPQAMPGNTVASIGFCAAEQKWAGWSHRALCKFGIGDRLFIEDYGDDNTLYVEHGPQVIASLDDARVAASNFANYVS